MKSPEELLFDLKVPESGLAISWFGQNSYALKDITGSVVLIDPYFPMDRPTEKFIHSERPVKEEKLKADAVLLTHDHSDHTCIESLNRLLGANPEMAIIGPPESVERLEAEGVSANLWPVVAGEARAAATMNAHALYSKLPGDADSCMHLGFVIETGGGRVYVTGDPQNDIADKRELFEPIRALSPDIGLLTTHPDEGEFPYFDGSARLAERIGVKVAIPSHYGCFVKRTFDPFLWADSFPGNSPERVIIPYRGTVMISVDRGWCGFY